MPHTVYHPGQILAGYDGEEFCPHCDDYIPYTIDPDDLDDLEVTCPVCGNSMMLCSSCPYTSSCDWDEKTGCRMDTPHMLGKNRQQSAELPVPPTIYYDTAEFTDDQLEQIDRIEAAMQEFLDVLLRKPAYLRRTKLESRSGADVDSAFILELADSIAGTMAERGFNVFFPTHTFTENREWVSETYNDDQKMEE